MTIRGPVAVTGAGGRLGRALVAGFEARDTPVLPWTRPDHDLDDPTAARRLLERDRPGLVIHPAAWTDVDGCARQPELATRRNADAVAELAAACRLGGADLVLVSTNEVFDGVRTDGRGYAEGDEARPINPYGASKLAGEEAVRKELGDGSGPAGNRPRAWIVRTAWLYGPPGNDFPSRILAAASRIAAGGSLPVVADETGSPTFTTDLADAIIRLVEVAPAGTYHLVNGGAASRADWASRTLQACASEVSVRPISSREYTRASTPPSWAVLDGSKAAGLGVPLRSWETAFADYVPGLCAPR